MADVAGINVYLEVYSGAAWIKVGGQRDTTFAPTSEDLETTDKDGGGWASHLVGIKSWEITADLIYDPTDAGIVILQNAYFNDTILTVRFKENVTSGKTYTGTATCKFEKAAPIDDIESASITLVGTGAVVEA